MRLVCFQSIPYYHVLQLPLYELYHWSCLFLILMYFPWVQHSPVQRPTVITVVEVPVSSSHPSSFTSHWSVVLVDSWTVSWLLLLCLMMPTFGWWRYIWEYNAGNVFDVLTQPSMPHITWKWGSMECTERRWLNSVVIEGAPKLHIGQALFFSPSVSTVASHPISDSGSAIWPGQR